MLTYNIETVDVIKDDSKLYIDIKGWSCSDNKIDIQVYIDGKLIATKIDYIYRVDVNESFNMNDDIKRGFNIKVKAKKGILRIVFNDGESQEEYLVEDVYESIKQYKKNRSIMQYINRHNLNKFIANIKTIGLRGTLTKINNKVKGIQKGKLVYNYEPYVYNYTFEEVQIPKEWLEIQKNQPSIGVIIELSEWEKEYDLGIKSLESQIYNKFKVYFAIKDRGLEEVIKAKLKGKNIEYQCVYRDELNIGRDLDDEYITVYSPYDILPKMAFAHFLEAINVNIKPDIIYSDYDNFEKNGEYHTRIRKSDIPLNKLNKDIITRGAWVVKHSTEITDDLNEYIETKLSVANEGDICYINKVLIHRRIIKTNKKNYVKALAFYLPQFHSIPENDASWGKGFTEWTNVKRAVPMFKGHNQPRKPEALGYYNLVEDKEIQYKQAELSKEHNVYGLCYYYYWFNGKKILEKPIENILKKRDIDQKFCICWANENWTKRWDGMEHEIILEQLHEQDSDERFIKDVIDIIKDDRYIRINNQPLILIYKVQLLQDGKETIKKWRQEVKQYGIEDIYVAIVKHPGIVSPEQYGADAMVEFPPHDMDSKNIVNTVGNLNKDFDGGIYDYSELANRDLINYDFTMFRSCMLQWDNTARRMESASIFSNFSPEDYKRWLLRIKEYEILFNTQEEQFIFINAWNEWAEGTYLEPDEKYGDTFLKITQQILESR